MRRLPGGRALFLGLLAVTTAACLLVDGYAHRRLGDSRTASQGSAAASALAEGAGPVLDFSGREVRAAHLRPGTVALTFDDGPDPRWTPAVLGVLAREGVPGTFFVVGSRALDHPGLVRRESELGEVGAHTFSHVLLDVHPAWQNRLEMRLTDQAIGAATGLRPVLLRPPYSSTPEAVTPADLRAWTPLGRSDLVVLADRDSEDWQRPGVGRIVANAMPGVTGAGAIVMFHDGGGDRSQTVRALPLVIDRLRASGYRFTTVSAGIGLVPALSRPRAGLLVRTAGSALQAADRFATFLAHALAVLLVGVAGLSLARAALLVVFASRHRRKARLVGDEQPAGGPVATELSVSVVVPAYNEAVGIGASLRTLGASDHPRVEIVVVDDGSTDATAEVVQGLMSELPRLRLVRQANAGKAHALNAGVRASAGDVVVLVDGDTVFEPDTIRRLVAPFTDPGVGAVAGNTKVGNRSGLLGRWQHIEYVVGFNLDRRLFDLTNCMQTVPGAIGAFRRQALEQVGGVPTDTLAEDTDLTIMLGLRGWRVAYEGSARAWTEAPATLRQLWSQRYRWAYGTMQASWKHRRALGARAVTGPGGATTHLGRFGLPYLLVFGVLLPLLAPLVDLFALVGLLYTPALDVAVAWGTFGAVQFGLAAYALTLDGERRRTLWALPLQQVVYRQLMYFVVVQSLASALAGSRLGWHKLERAGTAGEAIATTAG